jgi:hypothetical protein
VSERASVEEMEQVFGQASGQVLAQASGQVFRQAWGQVPARVPGAALKQEMTSKLPDIR